MQEKTRARLRILAAAALFSTGGAAIKACSLSGGQLAGLRSAVAALALLAMIPAARTIPRPRELLVGVAYSGALVFFTIACKTTTAANAIFLQYTAPFYLLLFGPWLLRERASRRDLAFLAAAAVSLPLFFLDASAPSATAPDPLLGNLMGILSGVCWAATLLGLRWLGRGGGSAYGSVVSGNAIAFAVCLPWILPLQLSYADLAVLLYLGVFQVALAYVLVTAALKELSAFEASILLLVEPVLNPLWAWLAHGERPGAWAFVGGSLLLGATAAKGWLDARAEAAATAPRAPGRS